MNNQNKKWNKELLYSTIFYITATSIFFLDPLGKMFDILLSLPTKIFHILADIGIFYIIPIARPLSIFGVIFFLFLSVYLSILSIKKMPENGKKKLFGFIPKNIPSFLNIFIILFSVINGLMTLAIHFGYI